MRDRDQPRFGRVFEVMMTAPNPHQIPTVRNNLAYQKSAIHITSVWCAWWLLYLLGFDDQHYNYQKLVGKPAQSLQPSLEVAWRRAAGRRVGVISECEGQRSATMARVLTPAGCEAAPDFRLQLLRSPPISLSKSTTTAAQSSVAQQTQSKDSQIATAAGAGPKENAGASDRAPRPPAHRRYQTISRR